MDAYERPLATPQAIDPRWCDVGMQGKREAPVWLFPRATLDLPEELHRRVIGTYLARGGDAAVGGYRAFISELLAEATQATKE